MASQRATEAAAKELSSKPYLRQAAPVTTSCGGSSIARKTPNGDGERGAFRQLFNVDDARGLFAFAAPRRGIRILERDAEDVAG